MSPSGREYGIMCTSSGTAFFDVTVPSNPQQVGYISGPGSLWRDVKVYEQFAYIVSEGGSGIQVVSMANIDNGQVTLTGVVNDVGTSNTHNVFIDEDAGFLYRTGGGGNGLRMYSLANPASPQYVGAWSSRYVHDAQVVTYTSGPNAGRQIAYRCAGLNGGSGDTGSASSTSPTSRTRRSSARSTGRTAPTATRAGSARTASTSTWATSWTRTVPPDDDLRDQRRRSRQRFLRDLVHEWQHGDHAQLLHQERPPLRGQLHERPAHLRPEREPHEPARVRLLRHVRGRTARRFNGLWSVFPYFPSGTVIGSDPESGFLVGRG